MTVPKSSVVCRAMDAPPKDLGVTEAAQVLGVHPDTLRAWADKGEVKSVKTVGGWRRFARADLDAFLAERTTGPDAA